MAEGESNVEIDIDEDFAGVLEGPVGPPLGLAGIPRHWHNGSADRLGRRKHYLVAEVEIGAVAAYSKRVEVLVVDDGEALAWMVASPCAPKEYEEEHQQEVASVHLVCCEVEPVMLLPNYVLLETQLQFVILE